MTRSAIHPLDGAYAYVARTVAATPEKLDAATLVFAVTHKIEAFNTVPRLAIRSKAKRSGKTTLLDAASLLCNNFWMSDPTPFALKSKFIDGDGSGVTVGLDEASKVFGASGLRGQGSPIYKLGCESYRKTATISISVDRAPMDIPTYCVMIAAGLGKSLPDDLLDRAIIVEMERAPASVARRLDDSLDEGVQAIGEDAGRALHAWVRAQSGLGDLAKAAKWRHPKLFSRAWQVWGSLFAIADAYERETGSSEWSQRCMRAFVALALDENERPVYSSHDQLLLDAASYLRTVPSRYLLSADLLVHLKTLERKVYQVSTDRQMAMLMSEALGAASVITLPSRKTARGWHAEAILAAASDVERDDTEEEEEVQDEYDTFFSDVDPGDDGLASVA